jgi:hypothetical protein
VIKKIKIELKILRFTTCGIQMFLVFIYIFLREVVGRVFQGVPGI